jgi:hypothetical protein
MSGIDYTLCYKRQLSLDLVEAASDRWTLFASAFNDSDRVRRVFEAVRAPKKRWLVHEEYRYVNSELPTNAELFELPLNDEAVGIGSWLASLGDLSGERICVDITGFMRPHVLFLVGALFGRGLSRFDLLYSDPERYTEKEETPFSKGPVTEVRQVAGFEGTHSSDTSNDVLVIASGYDDELIRRVAEAKENARKIQLFGFPSLQVEMYQESILRASRASEAIGSSANTDVLFAPANDPFVTAQVLSERLRTENVRRPVTNLYLSPLSTKPQTLGFGLFFEAECRQTAASIVFPFCERYERETTIGFARSWLYTVERVW